MIYEFRIGDVIGDRFKIFNISQGGMGIVYSVNDLSQEPPDQINVYGIALKTYKDNLDSESTKSIFTTESLTWIKLSHSLVNANIVKAVEVHYFNNRPFLELELINGVNLDIWKQLNKKAFQLNLIPTCIDIASQIAMGMDAAQRKIPGLVHQDLKPSNIMMQFPKQGFDEEFVLNCIKITDFGLVKILNSQLLKEMGNKSEQNINDIDFQKLGSTSYYMAPEVLNDPNTATPVSDIFSFGMIMYELLSISSESVNKSEILPKLRKSNFENFRLSPSKINSAIPSEMSNLIMRCLEFDPANRYQNFNLILAELVNIGKNYKSEIIARCWFNISSDFEEQFDRAVSFANLGNVDKAIELFNNLKNEHSSEVWANLGNCYIIKHEYRKALDCINQALEINPKHLFALTYKGNLYHAMGYFQDALKYYTQALEVDSNHLDALIYCGGILSNSRRYDEASELLFRAIQIAPKDFRANLFMGITLIEEKQIPKAIEYLIIATALDPSNPQAFYELGRAYMNIENYSAAKECFDTSAEMEPLPDVLFLMNECSKKIEELNKPKNIIKRLLGKLTRINKKKFIVKNLNGV